MKHKLLEALRKSGDRKLEMLWKDAKKAELEKRGKKAAQ